MRIKTVVTRQGADDDTDSIFEHYLREAGSETAVAFIDDLEQAYSHIRRFPQTGSTRYEEQFRTSGLRHWWLSQFPFIVVYREMDESIEIWRILHASMDIPARVIDPDSL